VSNESAKGEFLNLRAKSEGNNYYTLSKKRTYTYQSATITESVHYLYVDKDVTVSNTPAYSLELKNGWNAIYTKEETKNKHRTIEVRLRNPVLRWTLYYVAHSDNNSPQINWPSSF
jgi:hypothetical protein